jgi:hypothetical protein
MDDQKDRFGDKIHELEKAREDQWAREQDRVLLEKMRTQQDPLVLRCPRCEAQLVVQSGGELTIMTCPSGHGGWLDGAALGRLSERRK